MDRLFKRYACPFSLMDGYIQTARFREFIHAFVDEMKEAEMWEFYLHRVWDKSYDEFREALRTTQKAQAITDDEIETTVKKSMSILGNFNPNKGEENM